MFLRLCGAHVRVQHVGFAAGSMPAAQSGPLLQDVDGLIVCGDTTAGACEPGRDPDSWLAALREAAKGRMPVLALDGGGQWLTLARGGTLHPDAAAHYGVDPRQRSQTRAAVQRSGHAVKIAADSGLHRLTEVEELMIRVRNNQAIATPGEGLQSVAQDWRGRIFAVEDPHHPFCLGVDWAPHLALHQRSQRRLLQAFVRAASAVDPDADIAMRERA
ncbi:gamma-glutamyl-gamma-aminobutyrate hydrolase family protein [Phaeobacter sp.]|uniref:gamma-glutamyl-gamma-aminobutyrate hydrolase family protein n=1 Tax=Phaeobacter sp. TaxID=1902409 RepID=UPI0025F65178|nr:gamma-glutamyl-gamma-aminobutyrate hydrolase family protein [Phaeobacter sp.]